MLTEKERTGAYVLEQRYPLPLSSASARRWSGGGVVWASA